MHRWSLRIAAVLATLALALIGTGCGDDDDDGGGGEKTAESGQVEAGTYVGKVDGSNAYVALVTDGKTVDGYICDAKEISTWIGEDKLSDGGSVALSSRKGVLLGEATFEGDEATGKFVIDGKPHDFSAEPASGEAGLYHTAKGTQGKLGFVESGLIVLADGSQRGATNFVRRPRQVMADPMMIMADPMMIMADPMMIMADPMMIMPSPMGVMAEPMVVTTGIMPSPMIADVSQATVKLGSVGTQQLQQVESVSQIR